jgi:hypothetical protein
MNFNQQHLMAVKTVKRCCFFIGRANENGVSVVFPAMESVEKGALNARHCIKCNGFDR